MSNNTEMEKYFFRASAEDFKKIPGNPIIYDAGAGVYAAFDKLEKLIDKHYACSGLQTGNNDKYLKQWYEINAKFINEQNFYTDEKCWLFHRKGGEFRKWYGNIDYVLNWSNDGVEIKSSKSARPQNIDKWFSSGVTWSHTSSSSFSARLLRDVDTINVEGPSAFSVEPNLLLGYLSSKVAFYLMGLLNPTLHFLVGTVSKLPYINGVGDVVLVDRLIVGFKADWDSYETSWDFTAVPLLANEHRQTTLADTYAALRQHWLNTTLEMQRLEEENNRIFIDAYGLQDELTPDVPLKEITLTCNPYYRYGKEAEQQGKEYPLDAKLEERLRLDTIAEFISYAVGCMFGRYSLDKAGLILANQGESLKDYLAQVPNPSFDVDDDNVLPILDDGWFSDDIVERFRKFLRVSFGEQQFDANWRFIEQALGKDVRSYFLKDFYADHVQRYKKRPIYWLFSSPRGSFNALIYMHRYRPDTVSVVLNEYLREFRTKLQAQVEYQEALQISASASQSEKTKALKEIERLKKVLVELDDYERDVLYPLATEQIDIDLDDGVKVNYPKFGSALKKIAGLDAKEE